MADVVAALPGPLAHGSDTPAAISHHQGGSGANVAAWLVACGAAVAFAGRAGDDALELRELPAGGHLHLTGYTLLREGSRPTALRALALARERGVSVSVDPS